jgi:hypothetical protein
VREAIAAGELLTYDVLYDGDPQVEQSDAFGTLYAPVTLSKMPGVGLSYVSFRGSVAFRVVMRT